MSHQTLESASLLAPRQSLENQFLFALPPCWQPLCPALSHLPLAWPYEREMTLTGAGSCHCWRVISAALRIWSGGRPHARNVNASVFDPSAYACPPGVAMTWGSYGLAHLVFVALALINTSVGCSAQLCLLAQEAQVGAWREETPLPSQCQCHHCESHMEWMRREASS